jgi:glutathione peroxidase
MAQSIHEIAVRTAKGESRTLSQYKGNALIIVNVASACGFTPQYEGLEKLYQTYKEQGLHILAFPCNDFGAQEPGTMNEIEQFCKLNYGVTFELFEKLHCLGEERHPLYSLLVEQSESQEDVKWNFEKFVISRDGQLIERFSSKIAPDDESLVQAVEQALA